MTVCTRITDRADGVFNGVYWLPRAVVDHRWPMRGVPLADAAAAGCLVEWRSSETLSRTPTNRNLHDRAMTSSSAGHACRR